MFFLNIMVFSTSLSLSVDLVAAVRSPLLLDVAATEDGCAHVITDGLAGSEQQMIPLLGFLAKSQREAEFPIEILMRPGGISWTPALCVSFCFVLTGEHGSERVHCLEESLCSGCGK